MADYPYARRISLVEDERVPPEQRLATTAQYFEDLAEQSNKEAAAAILSQLDGTSPDDVDEDRMDIMTEAVTRLQAGTWKDLLFAGIGAFVGVFAGQTSHRIVDMSPKGIPVNGLVALGSASAVATLGLKNANVGARAAAASFGAGALAGSIIHVNQKGSHNNG